MATWRLPFEHNWQLITELDYKDPKLVCDVELFELICLSLNLYLPSLTFLYCSSILGIVILV